MNIMNYKQKKSKIKRETEKNIINWNYTISNSITGDIILKENICKEVSDKIKIHLSFVKKYMIRDLLIKEIGWNNVPYLDYIVEATLRPWQKIDIKILLEKNIIQESKYKSLRALLRKKNIIQKYNWNYYLNPYIASKTQTISTEVLEYFKWWEDWIKKIETFYNIKI